MAGADRGRDTVNRQMCIKRQLKEECILESSLEANNIEGPNHKRISTEIVGTDKGHDTVNIYISINDISEESP